MKQEQTKIFWNSKEFVTFIDNVTNKDMKLVFELSYYNGIAIQDILLLKMKDFHIYKGRISVDNESICREQNLDCDGGKLPGHYQVDMLENQKAEIQKYLVALAEYEKDEYVFQMSRQKLEREFYKVMENSKLRKMPIDNLQYCKRHIYCDGESKKIYCSKGYSEEEIAEGMNENRMEFTGKREVPIWKKLNLTLAEAAEYSGIGMNNLRKFCDENENGLVLWIGSKRLIKRKKLEELTEKLYTL